MKNKTEDEKRISGNFNPSIKDAIILILGSQKSIRQFQVQARTEYLIGKRRKASFLNAMKDLRNKGWVSGKSIEILPNRIPGDRKFQRYPNHFPKALDIILQDQKENNHSTGRYELYLFLNPKLPIEFLNKIKNQAAKAFGFRSWYDIDGSVMESAKDMLSRMKAHHKKALSQAEYELKSSLANTREPDAENCNDGNEGLFGDMTHGRHKSDEGNALFLNPKRFSRRTIKLLERYDSLSENTMKGGQRNMASKPDGKGSGDLEQHPQEPTRQAYRTF